MSLARTIIGARWIACALAAAVSLVQMQGASEILLHNFTGPPKGSHPYAGVIRDPVGNLYGTASEGGPANAGVVYRVDTASRQTVLYSFTGGVDGGNPYGTLIADSAGNLYGTTYGGGSFGGGTVYKIGPSGHQTLYSFAGADGMNPYSSVTRDAAGNLYGTTLYGGAGSYGTIYKLDTAGHLAVLYSFTGGTDGGQPYAGVARDSAGNLYGTTLYGGAAGLGAAYKLDTTGHETVLHSFTGGADGQSPTGAVVLDPAGNLYGTAFSGGAGAAGVVYKLDPAGNDTVLYSFMNGADGGYPYAGVIRDSAGNLYGTTQGGGAAYGGVVYELDTSGHEAALYSFVGGSDGNYPYSGVTADKAGKLYGTTQQGGTGRIGTVYSVTSTGQHTVLYSFPGTTDGGQPYAGVISDSAGNLYGTTFYGGEANSGVVYRMDATGHEEVLYTFTGGFDGANPAVGVIRDAAGNLYGTTQYGGFAGWGVVYKLDTAGMETVLHSFTGVDGGFPNSGVIRDPAGNLYGTASSGGTGGAGLVYKLDAAGNFKALYNFTGGVDGGGPYGGVVLDSAGNLYGTTQFGGTAGLGVVYKLDRRGHETVLYSFTGGADGGNPYAGVIRDSAGNLYGTTLGGGYAGWGVVYKLDTTGAETVLHTFTGTDGGFPYAGVIRDSAGNLYGTTVSGGTAYDGVVYKLNTAGQETVLYNFTGTADGNYPRAGVLRDAAGNLYGTTVYGGKRYAGVVFRVSGRPMGSYLPLN